MTPEAPAAGAPAAPAAPEAYITIDDFMKVELRMAKILTAERLPKSKKLLKLSVDAGEASRARSWPASPKATNPKPSWAVRS